MTDAPSAPTPDDEAIEMLIAVNPAKADKLLREMGYSLEEWQRARHAPPAVDHASGHMPAAPALEPVVTTG